MDLLLDRNTHDLVIEPFDLKLVSGIDLIRQRLKQRLLTIRGEWFLNQEIGLPWFAEINAKGTPEARIRALLIEQITETEGVLTLDAFELDYNSRTRTMLLQFEVTATAGQIQMELAL
jgi:hypothetical protein